MLKMRHIKKLKYCHYLRSSTSRTTMRDLSPKRLPTQLWQHHDQLPHARSGPNQELLSEIGSSIHNTQPVQERSTACRERKLLCVCVWERETERERGGVEDPARIGEGVAKRGEWGVKRSVEMRGAGRGGWGGAWSGEWGGRWQQVCGRGRWRCKSKRARRGLRGGSEMPRERSRAQAKASLLTYKTLLGVHCCCRCSCIASWFFKHQLRRLTSPLRPEPSFPFLECTSFWMRTVHLPWGCFELSLASRFQIVSNQPSKVLDPPLSLDQGSHVLT